MCEMGGEEGTQAGPVGSRGAQYCSRKLLYGHACKNRPCPGPPAAVGFVAPAAAAAAAAAASAAAPLPAADAAASAAAEAAPAPGLVVVPPVVVPVPWLEEAEVVCLRSRPVAAARGQAGAGRAVSRNEQKAGMAGSEGLLALEICGSSIGDTRKVEAGAGCDGSLVGDHQRRQGVRLNELHARKVSAGGEEGGADGSLTQGCSSYPCNKEW